MRALDSALVLQSDGVLTLWADPQIVIPELHGVTSPGSLFRDIVECSIRVRYKRDEYFWGGI